MLLLPRASHKPSPRGAPTADFQPRSLWALEASIRSVFSCFVARLHCRERGWAAQGLGLWISEQSAEKRPHLMGDHSRAVPWLYPCSPAPRSAMCWISGGFGSPGLDLGSRAVSASSRDSTAQEPHPALSARALILPTATKNPGRDLPLPPGCLQDRLRTGCKGAAMI